MNALINWLKSPAAIGTAIVIAVAVVLMGFALWLERKAKNSVRGNKSRATTVHITSSIVNFIIILVAIIVVLQVNGVNITAMVAGLGIVGAIVGLALQDLLKDVIMGVNIIFDRYFAVGDCVEFEGREGEVVGFNIKSTKIRDIDDHSVFTVCNRNISQIRCLSDHLEIDVPLPYALTAERAHEILHELSLKIEAIEDVDSCEFKGTERFDSSAVVYRLTVKCKPTDRPDVRRKVLLAVQLHLKSENVAIPYSQLDVHLDKD